MKVFKTILPNCIADKLINKKLSIFGFLDFIIPYNSQKTRLHFFSYYYLVITPALKRKFLVNVYTPKNHFFYSFKQYLVIMNYSLNLCYRISFDRGKPLIKRNFQNLNVIEKLNGKNYPKPIKINNSDSYLISIESLVPGNHLKSINSKNFIKIIEQISLLYRSSLKKIGYSEYSNILKSSLKTSFKKGIIKYDIYLKLKKQFNCINNHFDNDNIRVSLIHGDLTRNNIKKSNDKFYFFDLDRMHYNFPEFDIITLLLFDRSKVYPDYIMLLNNKKFIITLRKKFNIFYTLCGDFKSNYNYFDHMINLYKLSSIINYYSDLNFNPTLKMYERFFEHVILEE